MMSTAGDALLGWQYQDVPPAHFEGQGLQDVAAQVGFEASSSTTPSVLEAVSSKRKSSTIDDALGDKQPEAKKPKAAKSATNKTSQSHSTTRAMSAGTPKKQEATNPSPKIEELAAQAVPDKNFAIFPGVILSNRGILDELYAMQALEKILTTRDEYKEAFNKSKYLTQLKEYISALGQWRRLSKHFVEDTATSTAEVTNPPIIESDTNQTRPSEQEDTPATAAQDQSEIVPAIQGEGSSEAFQPSATPSTSQNKISSASASNENQTQMGHHTSSSAAPPSAQNAVPTPRSQAEAAARKIMKRADPHLKFALEVNPNDVANVADWSIFIEEFLKVVGSDPAHYDTDGKFKSPLYKSLEEGQQLLSSLDQHHHHLNMQAALARKAYVFVHSSDRVPAAIIKKQKLSRATVKIEKYINEIASMTDSYMASAVYDQIYRRLQDGDGISSDLKDVQSLLTDVDSELTDETRQFYEHERVALQLIQGVLAAIAERADARLQTLKREANRDEKRQAQEEAKAKALAQIQTQGAQP